MEPFLLRRLREAGITNQACLTDEEMKRIRELSGRQTAVHVLSAIRKNGYIPLLRYRNMIA